MTGEVSLILCGRAIFRFCKRGTSKKKENKMRDSGVEPFLAPAPVIVGNQQREEDRWRHFDNSVNAVSFGFVATAILISMFLVMAIFERFLRPRSPRLAPSGLPGQDVEGGSRAPPPLKPNSTPPKMAVYAKGVSVLMPGQEIPTYIAHPVPPPCPPEQVL